MVESNTPCCGFRRYADLSAKASSEMPIAPADLLIIAESGHTRRGIRWFKPNESLVE